MNQTAPAFTMTHLLGTRPMAPWFTELTGEAQTLITEMVNEQGYPLSDLQEFVEEFGEEYLLDGTYLEWEQLSNDYHEDAIAAFVAIEGINELTYRAFTSAYLGQWDSPADFAEEWFLEHQGYDIPDGIVVDWEQTYDNSLDEDFINEDGYFFNRHW
jgi:hypothetical protein